MQGIKLSFLWSTELYSSTLLKQVLNRTFEPASFEQAASSLEKECAHQWDITVHLTHKQTRNAFKELDDMNSRPTYLPWVFSCISMYDLCSTLGIQELPSCTVVLQGGCCSDRKGKGIWHTEALQHGELREMQGDYPCWELTGEGDESTDQGKAPGELWPQGLT